MKLSQLFSLTFLFASQTGVSSMLRSSKEASMKPPLDIDLVVKSVASYLWEDLEDGLPKKNFVIKGSYPAAVKAYEEQGLLLPYNDIDVFFASDDCSRDMTISYVKDIIPGSDIEVNTVGVCDFDENLGAQMDVDINAVAVGLKVVPNATMSDEVVPIIDSWVASPHFEEFLESKTLSITPTGFAHTPGSALIRLISKAQQLNVPFVLPSNHTQIEQSFHGAPIPTIYKKRLEALDRDHKAQFDKSFEVHETDSPYWYRVGLKGKPLPETMRNLQTSGYDDPKPAPDTAATPAPVPSPSQVSSVRQHTAATTQSLH